jgi:hypothetical protein
MSAWMKGADEGGGVEDKTTATSSASVFSISFGFAVAGAGEQG